MKMNVYRYEISGSYLVTDNKGVCERKHFDEVISATDNVEAMRKIIGEFAWQASLEEKMFKLDTRHYECL